MNNWNPPTSKLPETAPADEGTSAVGRMLATLSDREVIEVVAKSARGSGIEAYELDWRTWEAFRRVWPFLDKATHQPTTNPHAAVPGALRGKDAIEPATFGL